MKERHRVVEEGQRGVETDRVVYLNVTYREERASNGVGCASLASATTLANP